MNLLGEVPMGFSMALAKNTNAMKKFSNLSKEQQQKVIEQTHSINSKQEMQNYVNNLTNTNFS